MTGAALPAPAASHAASRNLSSSRRPTKSQLMTAACPLTTGQLVLERKIHRDVCPGPGSAADADPAAQGLDAVGEPGQAGTARRIGPADAIVTDRQQQAGVAHGERNLNA